MERMTKRTTSGWCTIAGDLSPAERVLMIPSALTRLAAYEDTGLMPEEITIERPACVFYCNRQCNLNGDFCAEGPGCPFELDGAEARQFLLQVTQPNEPLTLEELFNLDQEPVWVHYFGCQAFHKSAWAFVCAKHSYCETARGGIEPFERYGKTWLAYRRKPDEKATASKDPPSPSWAAHLQSRFLRVE